MKDGYDEKQKRLLLNLDILTRAEQRSESLRKQRFDLLEKENSIQTRLDQIEIDIRPENIERQVAVMGTLRPEEIREAKQKSLDSERKNLQALLAQVQSTRGSLDQTVDKAEQLVQKLRVALEADIDKTLGDGKDNPQP
jgi:chromosome segregation ATPase